MNRARLNKVEVRGEAPGEINRAVQDRDASLLELFEDPRNQRERRVRRQLDLVPNTGCRRSQRRRNRAYLNENDWWIKRRYTNGD
jgi:hypothetical protein